MGKHIKSKDNNVSKDYFKLHILLLRIIGISVNENEHILYKFYQLLVLTIFVLGFLILQVHGLTTQNWEVITTLMTYFFGFLTAAIKYVTFFFKGKQIGNVLKKLEQPPFVPKDNKNRIKINLINTCVWIIKIQTCLYFTSGIISNSLSIIIAIRKGELTYGPITIIDATRSPNYEILFVYQCLSAHVYLIVFMMVDLILAGLVAHMCYQCKILQNNINQLIKKCYIDMLKPNNLKIKDINESNIDVSQIPWKYLKEGVAEIVGYHLKIIELIKDIESIGGYVLLAEFLCTLGILCFEIFILASMPIYSITFFASFMEWACGCFQIALICFWGQRIQIESEELSEALYNINFYGTDLRFQKALAIMIQRCQKPVKITAAKFADVNLLVFTWIMKSSYSAYMIIQNKNKQSI